MLLRVAGGRPRAAVPLAETRASRRNVYFLRTAPNFPRRDAETGGRFGPPSDAAEKATEAHG
jgi:hypothetical protein